MKKARFTETRILPVLKEVEGGRHVKDLWRENAVRKPALTTGKPNIVAWCLPILS
jgi:hypothetical protein